MTLGHFSPGEQMPIVAPIILSKFQAGKKIKDTIRTVVDLIVQWMLTYGHLCVLQSLGQQLVENVREIHTKCMLIELSYSVFHS